MRLKIFHVITLLTVYSFANLLKFESKRNSSVFLIEEKTEITTTLKISIHKKNAENPIPSPCGIQKNRAFTGLVHNELTRLFNAHTDTRKKQLAFLSGTLIGFLVNEILPSKNTRQVKSEFHNKMRLLECEIYNLDMKVENKMIALRVRQLIYHLRTEVDFFENSLAGKSDSYLKTEYFSIICKNSSHPKICEKNGSSHRHKILEQRLILNKEESFVELKVHGSIFSKFEDVNGSLKVLFRPPEMKKNKWYGFGEEISVLTHEDFQIDVKKCPITDYEENIFVCHPNQAQIFFEKRPLYLNQTSCYTKIIGDILILSKPAKTCGNITYQEKDKRISEVKSLNPINVIKLSRTIHVRCDRLVFTLQPKKSEKITFEVTESLDLGNFSYSRFSSQGFGENDFGRKNQFWQIVGFTTIGLFLILFAFFIVKKRCDSKLPKKTERKQMKSGTLSNISSIDSTFTQNNL